MAFFTDDPFLQLMELAGLACAQTVAQTYPAKTHKQVLVIVGPGNQVRTTSAEWNLVVSKLTVYRIIRCREETVW